MADTSSMNPQAIDETTDRLAGAARDTTDRAAANAHASTDRLAATAHQATDRLASTMHQAADRVATGGKAAVERLQTTARTATERWGQVSGDVMARRDEALDSARDAVRERPITALGIAFAVGWLVAKISR